MNVAKFAKAVSGGYSSACAKLFTGFQRHSNVIMLVAGTALIGLGLAETSHAASSYINVGYEDSQVRGAVGLIFQLIEGAFGALIMVVAGLAAIVAAAAGAYRAAMGALVVAVGAFILRALVSLFFGTNFTAPSAG